MATGTKIARVTLAAAALWVANSNPASAQRVYRQPRAFPIVINASGSYKLIGNLMVPNANTTAIRIVDPAKDVTIDLNGFTISGPTVCTGTPPTLNCTPTGSGYGIEATGVTAGSLSLTVRNGTIRGMGSGGIQSGGANVVEIEGVKALSNGGDGVSVGFAGSVSNCIAMHNAGVGIFAADVAVVNCVADGNEVSGIVSTGAHVTGNRANYNGEHGIHIDSPGYPGSVVAANIVYGNQDAGILVESRGAIVRDNTALDNVGQGIALGWGVVTGNVAGGNGGDGFTVGQDSVALANSSSANGGVGLTALSYGNVLSHNSLSTNVAFGLRMIVGSDQSTGYSGNVADNNNGGNANAQVNVAGGGAAIEIGTNVCGGDTTCP